jgi:hypothetical protein
MLCSVLGAADAVARMLELLAQHQQAQEFFKASIVHGLLLVLVLRNAQKC